MAEPRRVRTQAERDADGQAWRHEADVYAAAGQKQQPWAISEMLNLCPMVCPDHQRHCDAGDQGHTNPHACSLCEHWRAVGDFGPVPEPPRPPLLAVLPPEPPPAVDLSWVTTTDLAPPRRRWWHRYTRRPQ